jgi:hypothetical protein
MEDIDMTFDMLEHVMPGDYVYFALGSALSHINDISAITNQDIDEIVQYMELLGELADKPGKVDSKINRLKTRNFAIESKRNSEIELNIVGISKKRKDYLESSLFQEKDVTILITDKDKSNISILTDPGYRCLLFDAMRWTADWSAEVDGLWTVVLSTAVSGSTASKILPFTTIIPE